MKLTAYLKVFLMVGLAAMLGCGDSSSDPVPSVGSDTTQSIAPAGVYTLTNNAVSNTIRQYERNVSGGLNFVGDFITGGNGDATDLAGASGSLIFQQSSNRFYAVNAGSNTISAMVLGQNGDIAVLSTVSSNGVRPISITAIGDLVYVLNYGSATIPANIAGFKLVGSQLVPINGSSQLLSTANPNPAQIGFHNSGSVLVVTERDTNNIITFRVDSNGSALPGISQGSSGNTPSGFDFTPNGLLVVAEANNNVIGGGSSSVYNVGTDGSLLDLSTAVPNGQTGTRSAFVYASAPFAFFSNALSDNISSYGLDANGNLLLQGNGDAGQTEQAPNGIGVTNDGLFLYTLNYGSNTISGFSVNLNGTLSPIGVTRAVSPNGVGLVVR